MLVGKVNKTGNKYDEKTFFAGLEKLMYEHGVNKVEAYWGVPELCHACGSHPAIGGDNTDITHVESDDLGDFDGDVVQSRNGLNKATALEILEKVVVKNDDVVSISSRPCDNGVTCEMCDCEFPRCNCDDDDDEDDDEDDYEDDEAYIKLANALMPNTVDNTEDDDEDDDEYDDEDCDEVENNV